MANVIQRSVIRAPFRSGHRDGRLARAAWVCNSRAQAARADAWHALGHAVAQGAAEFTAPRRVLDLPGIVEIGGSLIYFTDLYGDAASPDGAAFHPVAPPKPNGPIFFEFTQRKGDDGFDEGNFRALVESMEQDRIDHGVLNAV